MTLNSQWQWLLCSTFDFKGVGQHDGVGGHTFSEKNISWNSNEKVDSTPYQAPFTAEIVKAWPSLGLTVLCKNPSCSRWITMWFARGCKKDSLSKKTLFQLLELFLTQDHIMKLFSTDFVLVIEINILYKIACVGLVYISG